LAVLSAMRGGAIREGGPAKDRGHAGGGQPNAALARYSTSSISFAPCFSFPQGLTGALAPAGAMQVGAICLRQRMPDGHAA